nr:Dihydrofolate reductase [uncultured bacterium]
MQKSLLNAVVAIGRNRELGKDNQLLWRIPDDLKRFKALTMGHPLVMGRKTYESIGRPLPGRTNIVVTRDPNWRADGIEIFHSLEEALARARELDQEEIFLGGGSEIYRQAFPQIDRLYLTLIDDEKDADTFFPKYEKEFTSKTFEEAHEWEGLRYRWINLERA